MVVVVLYNNKVVEEENKKNNKFDIINSCGGAGIGNESVLVYIRLPYFY